MNNTNKVICRKCGREIHNYEVYFQNEIYAVIDSSLTTCSKDKLHTITICEDCYGEMTSGCCRNNPESSDHKKSIKVKVRRRIKPNKLKSLSKKTFSAIIEEALSGPIPF